MSLRRHPILILLTINILIGLFVFRDYGLSWDEPLFYDYAEALGYAYSPHEWFSGNFNLENAYGSSGTDHATRGPAYILLARQPVHLLESLGLDSASAWHLVNFLTFQLGVYFLYRLCLRWMKPMPALAAAAFFSTQPLLWGHAFINPKDPPFLVFFLISVYLGFEMADRISEEKDNKPALLYVILPAIVLGITTSIRVLGPLAGIIVALYAFRVKGKSAVLPLLVYAIIALVAMFACWPYLWPDPFRRFAETFLFMSDNPTQLAVLFNGTVYHANELPLRYLPVLLAITLGEFVWILFAFGYVASFWKKQAYTRVVSNDIPERRPLFSIFRSLFSDHWLLTAWFVFPILYVFLRRPSMYDGFRHFLFILPPVFVFAGFAFDKLFDLFKNKWLQISLVAIIFAPNIIAAIELHPYEYAYYNLFVGGTGGAFRTYETEYWLTCYKEAMEKFQARNENPATIYVHREASIAATYANQNVTALDERGALKEIKSGDFILVNTRTNEDKKTFPDAEIVLTVQRAGATFCVIKKAP